MYYLFQHFAKKRLGYFLFIHPSTLSFLPSHITCFSFHLLSNPYYLISRFTILSFPFAIFTYTSFLSFHFPCVPSFLNLYPYPNVPYLTHSFSFYCTSPISFSLHSFSFYLYLPIYPLEKLI